MYLESISEKFSIYKDESPRWATLIHEGQRIRSVWRRVANTHEWEEVAIVQVKEVDLDAYGG